MEKITFKRALSKECLTPKRVEYEIKSYDIIKCSENLLIAFKGIISDENNIESDYYKIFKVQFIASCKTKEFEPKFTAAFWIGEFGMLENTPLNTANMPNGYWFENDFALIDYRSYCEINLMLLADSLSLSEYVKSIFKGSEIHNSF